MIKRKMDFPIDLYGIRCYPYINTHTYKHTHTPSTHTSTISRSIILVVTVVSYVYLNEYNDISLDELIHKIHDVLIMFNPSKFVSYFIT